MMTETQSKTVREVAVAAAKEMFGEAVVLDVRTPAEFEEVHIEGAELHPLGELNPTEVKRLMEGRKHCVVVCRSGTRAKQAATKLSSSGLDSVVVMEGGMTAWEDAGLPVNRGQKTMSLERQVRIAAGALVFTGVVLGVTVSPLWLGLSGFVGAGLVFAGVTDTCAMGMMIARMPWNNRRPAGSCCTKS